MASNPAVVLCPDGVWTKVADESTSGAIHNMSTNPNVYRQTYRLAGETAPTNDDDAIPIFLDESPHEFSSDAPIDVYIKAVGAEGRVRADL